MSDTVLTASTLELPAVLESLPRFTEFLSHFAQKAGFDMQKIHEIELASEEAIVNIVNYAYGDTPGTIEVTCRVEPDDRFLIEIADSGMPFDPLEAKKPDLDADIDKRPVGGLGIYLAEKLMDDMRYRRESDKNILTLVILKTWEHKRP